MCEWFSRATPLLPSPCCEIFTLSIFATDIQDKTVFFFLGLKAKITSLSAFISFSCYRDYKKTRPSLGLSMLFTFARKLRLG